MPQNLKTERTTLRRLPDRGSHEREAIYRILDEGFVCHIGFAGADGQPYVIPTGYGRKDGVVYIHGSAASRMLRDVAKGVPVCLTVTLLDGLVLARSAFHHSMNYRSVVALGHATLVEAEDEKWEALRVITEHIVPGRWDDARQPSAQEMKATHVLKLPLTEASAKIRSGPPKDDEEDYALPIWAGVLPLKMTPQTPEADPRLKMALAVPEYIARYSRARERPKPKR